MSINTVNSATSANAITHGGNFHADEVFASAILEKVFGHLSIFRSFKVPEDIAPGTIVYDIGYGEFDHHQKDGNGCRENSVPYAACGLIWKEFGLQVLANSVNPKLVWEWIDRDLIQGIDAVDNGKMPKAEYPAQAMTISQVISGFNPAWNSSDDANTAFLRAVDFARMIFDNLIAKYESKAKAQEIVEEAISCSEDHVMVLDRFVPWQDAIFASEQEKAKEILFVVFPSNRGGYNWQCVPEALGSFAQRKPVPTAWKGLNGPALQKVTGVASASFCHPAGFIGGADTYADAIKLATIAASAE